MDRARTADGRSRGSIQAAAGWGRAERKRHLNQCSLLALRYQCGHTRTATRPRGGRDRDFATSAGSRMAETRALRLTFLVAAQGRWVSPQAHSPSAAHPGRRPGQTASQSSDLRHGRPGQSRKARISSIARPNKNRSPRPPARRRTYPAGLNPPPAHALGLYGEYLASRPSPPPERLNRAPDGYNHPSKSLIRRHPRQDHLART